MDIDPFLFTDEAVAEETRTFNAQLQALLTAMPKTSASTPEKVRAERSKGLGLWGPVIHSDDARTITIEGPSGDLDLRIIEKGPTNGVYLHIHGGGWVLGAADLSDVGNEAMASEAAVTVVAVDYRLAPEHPFPAAVEDCAAAASWLIENAEREFGASALTIGGESAGANLAAATLLWTRDHLGYTGWSGANLVYGSYFPPGSPSVRNWTTDGLILDSDTMSWFADHYFGGQDWDPYDPYLSPLFGDLAGMPRALFTVGTWDPLLDDTLFMAMRWMSAGRSAELSIAPGGIHAFDAFPTAIGTAARERMYQFVKSAVAADTVVETAE